MKDTSTDIEIPISKTKILLVILGCLVFVILSLHMWTTADSQVRRSPIVVKIVSVLGVSFFGLGLVIGPKKLFDKRPGLVINENGIQNNLGIGPGMFLAWENIIRFEVRAINSTKFLLIFVNNSDEIIEKQNWWNQKIMRYSLKRFGTPISIGSGTLKIKFDLLTKVLTDKHAAFQNK